MQNPPSPTAGSSPERIVYLVDDDPDDAFIFEQALLGGFPNCQVGYFENGLMMFERMSQTGQIPHLIFLDQQMPLPDGLEVLVNLKSNNHWAAIPVIILSGMEDPQKARLAYQWGAATVIQKPTSYEQYVELIRVLRHYWFTVAYLPGQGQA